MPIDHHTMVTLRNLSPALPPKKKVSAVKPSLTTSPTATTRVRERNPLNVHSQAISHPSN
jgi:hypothetical protein